MNEQTNPDAVTEIRGTITLEDGTTSEFSVTLDSFGDYGFQQWGANVPRLGRTVETVEAIRDALNEQNA